MYIQTEFDIIDRMTFRNNPICSFSQLGITLNLSNNLHSYRDIQRQVDSKMTVYMLFSNIISIYINILIFMSIYILSMSSLPFILSESLNLILFVNWFDLIDWPTGLKISVFVFRFFYIYNNVQVQLLVNVSKQVQLLVSSGK